jgi:hypothetical protein
MSIDSAASGALIYYSPLGEQHQIMKAHVRSELQTAPGRTVPRQVCSSVGCQRSGVVYSGAAGGCKPAHAAGCHTRHCWADCWSSLCSAVHLAIPLGVLRQQATA